MHPDNLSWLGDGHRGTVGENDYTLSVFYAFILLQIFFYKMLFLFAFKNCRDLFYVLFSLVFYCYERNRSIACFLSLKCTDVKNGQLGPTTKQKYV